MPFGVLVDSQGDQPSRLPGTEKFPGTPTPGKSWANLDSWSLYHEQIYPTFLNTFIGKIHWICLTLVFLVVEPCALVVMTFFFPDLFHSNCGSCCNEMLELCFSTKGVWFSQALVSESGMTVWGLGCQGSYEKRDFIQNASRIPAEDYRIWPDSFRHPSLTP